MQFFAKKGRALPFPTRSGEFSQFGDSEKLLQPEDTSDIGAVSPDAQRYGKGSLALTTLNVLLLLLSATIWWRLNRQSGDLRQNINNSLIKAVDFFSPLHDVIDIQFVERQINGSLLPMHDSIYRAPPSPEVDEAWERLGSLMPHVVSTADILRLGKDPTKTARVPEDWGFGSDAHFAELDVLHTIHCLNAIRRDVHWQHYFGDRYPDGKFPELHRVHTDHCIHVILQNLMCAATVDIVTTPWVEGQVHPFPDFSVNKKCRDFDAILEWHESTMITDMEGYGALRMPEDHVPYAMSDEFLRMFGVGMENLPFNKNHSHGKI